MNHPLGIGASDSEPILRRLQEETGATFEIISGVPVFTLPLETNGTNQAVLAVIRSFGEETVLRIINPHFVPDVLEFGTDRIGIDEHDFRSIIFYITGYGYGHDVWGVEDAAREMGLTGEDVFCGTSHENFLIQRSSGYSGIGLGLPNDRSAVLIFDANKVKKIEGTDGYAFNDPRNKKQALLAVVKFREQPLPFEAELATLETVDDKIALLEREISQMNTPDDLRKAFYIALNIVTLLRHESLHPSPTAGEHIQKLKDLVELLKKETTMITTVVNFQSRIAVVRNWLTKEKAAANQPLTERGFMDQLFSVAIPRKPDKIIQDLVRTLDDPTLNAKYRPQLEQIAKDAERCKQELVLGMPDHIRELQRSVQERFGENLES